MSRLGYLCFECGEIDHIQAVCRSRCMLPEKLRPKRLSEKRQMWTSRFTTPKKAGCIGSSGKSATIFKDS
ncbi:hypothetical protein EG68_00462 [Paragonimus skrjabini miyazakii]|uniref:Uncharacterized protein n=1 Tax=Paragonimus skrjabini miyazakii TaxID=59628 RepID=A0A8S9Z5L0_9TREM|nr:hypothetical protein EG68_00462 [Paragonimus skrjabini miyazakii]